LYGCEREELPEKSTAEQDPMPAVWRTHSAIDCSSVIATVFSMDRSVIYRPDPGGDHTVDA